MSLYSFSSRLDENVEQYNVGDRIIYNGSEYIVVQKTFQESSADTTIEITYSLEPAEDGFDYLLDEHFMPTYLCRSPHILTQRWDGKEEEISEETRQEFIKLLE